MVVCVPRDYANAAACGASLVENATQTCHSRAGIPPDEVGSSFALPAGRAHAQGSAAAGERRFGEPSAIADAVLWLCGPTSTYMIGHALTVDGGFLSR
ncbi:SDR family oxidoreductase [Paraburkholderia fungorum]|uniref:SDR family oxidoreductase n=1 Tax=Paraburkholderia fungorum TaxID=134537 RepID=UPI0038BB303B